jgi:hypothetical protein
MVTVQVLVGIVCIIIGLIFTIYAKPLSAMPIFRTRKGIKLRYWVSLQEYWGKEVGIKITFYVFGIIPLAAGILFIILNSLGIYLF